MVDARYSPSSAVTVTLQRWCAWLLKRTVPPISAIWAIFLGLRASNSSSTREDPGDIAAGNAAGVEGTHRQLGTRLADGLGRDDTDGLAVADRRPVARFMP